MIQQHVHALVRNNARAPWARRLAHIAERYLQSYYNERHWDAETNGEFWFFEQSLKCLMEARGRQIIGVADIGANRGDWVMRAAAISRRLAAEARFECFEPNPKLCDQLEQVCAALGNGSVSARAHPVAVGLASGARQLHVPRDNSMASFALRPGIDADYSVSIEVWDARALAPVFAGQTLGFLKIDAEGTDVEALSAMIEIVARDRPFAQFEYGKTYLPSRAQLRDAYELLAPLDYAIGRLHPRWATFSPYDLDRVEHFRYGNYVAVPEEMIGCIERAKL